MPQYSAKPQFSTQGNAAKRISWLGAGPGQSRLASHGLLLGAALVAFGVLGPAPAEAVLVSEDFQAHPVQNDAVGFMPDPEEPEQTVFVVTTTGAIGAPIVAFVCCNVADPTFPAQPNSAGIAQDAGGNRFFTVGSTAGTTEVGGDFDRLVSEAGFIGNAGTDGLFPIFGGQIGPFFNIVRDLSNASFSVRVRAANGAQGTEFRIFMQGPDTPQGEGREIVTARFPLTNAFQTFTVTSADFTTNLNPIAGAFDFTQVTSLEFEFFAATTTAPALEFHIDDVVLDTGALGALAAAVLPGSRSVQVGDTATAFAVIINSGEQTATDCGIAPITSVPADFLFQTTDPLTNVLTGTSNTPVDIAGGNGFQTYVFAFTPTAPIASTEVQLSFACTNAGSAKTVTGLNTLLLSASDFPVPDIVALAATLNNDGIVDIPGTTGTGVFAVATVNVGGAGAMITATADKGGASFPADIIMCETDPVIGDCLSAPVNAANGVSTQIDAGETPTFGVFVTGTGNVAFDPATNRVFVRFTDNGGVVRGATSVAARTQ
jgi:hypothetical protein